MQRSHTRKTDIITITHSSRSMNLTCPKKYYFRHVRQIVPDRDDSNLVFGHLIHGGLETWHSTGSLEEVYKVIEKECAGHEADETKHHDYLVARAMMTAYAEKYPDDGWTNVRPEVYWEVPLVNPATGKRSWRLTVAGVTDLVFKKNGNDHQGEHKTTGQASGAYFDRLWEDPQIQLYMTMAAEAYGITPKSMIYNVLVKPKLQQKLQSESDAEFAARQQGIRNEYAAKKKEKDEKFQERWQTSLAKVVPRKTEDWGSESFKERLAKKKKELLDKKTEQDETLKQRYTDKFNALERKMPESDAHFYEKLLDWFRTKDAFHREEIYVNPRQIETLRWELWKYGQHLLRQYRENVWLRNRSACWSYNRICGYWNVCNAVPEDEDWAIENFCRHEKPHGELIRAKERQAALKEEMEVASDLFTPEMLKDIGGQ